MKDRLKIGNRVSCVIEEIFPNFLHLSFRSAGIVYRGALINETCSTVKRTIPKNYYKEKDVLQQEVTDALYNEVNLRDSDIKSKGLRSKKSKQSYIVLDDYIYKTDKDPVPDPDLKSEESEASVEKSPIDSLFGLVESIDSNIDRPLPFFDKSLDPLDRTHQGDGATPNSSKRKLSLSDDEEKNDSDSSNKLIKVKKRKDHVDTDVKVCVIERLDVKKDVKVKTKDPVTLISPATKDKVEPAIKTPDERKKRRKRILYNPKSRGRSLKIASSTTQLTPEEILKEDALPIVKVEKRKIERKSVGASGVTRQKRIDPIALALKNIKNRENTRRRQRLGAMTRRAFSTSPNDLLRKAERKPLRKHAKKKKKSAKEIEAQKEEEQKAKEEEKTKEEEKAKEEEKEDNVEEEKGKQRREKPILERSVTRSVAAKTKDGISTRNRKYTLVEETALKIVKKSRSLKSQRPNDSSKTTRVREEASSPSKVVHTTLSPVVKIVNQSLSIRLSSRDVTGSGEMDLTCHEKVISPNSTSSLPPQQQRKNRRKPLHVFKSLPNPAVEPSSTQLNEEYKDIDQIAHPPLPTITQPVVVVEDNKLPENMFNNKHVIAVSSAQLSPSPSSAGSSDLLGRPYKITVSRMNRPTLIPRRYLDSAGKTPAYQTLVQKQIKPSPLKNLRKPQTTVVANSRRNSIEVSDTASTTSSISTTSSGMTSPFDDDVIKNKDGGKDKVVEKEKNEKINKSNPAVTSKKPKKRKKQAIFDFHYTLKSICRSKNDIRNGDMIWGKIMGYGWWPGRVLSDSQSSKPGNRRVFCTWFGSNTNSIMNVDELEIFLPNFEKRFDVRRSSNSYTKAVIQAQHCCRKKYGVK